MKIFKQDNGSALKFGISLFKHGYNLSQWCLYGAFYRWSIYIYFGEFSGTI